MLHPYSLAALIGENGSIEEYYEYDAYGKCTVHTDDGADDTWLTSDDTTAAVSAQGNPYTFTGQRLDELDNGSLLIMYYKNRYYLVDIGRFIQRDPLGINPAGNENNPFDVTFQYDDGMNLYEYVGGMVVVSKDPDGLRRRKIDTKAFIKGFLSGITGLLGVKQDFRICTRVMGLGCACLIVRGEMTVTQCCNKGRRQTCNVNRLDVSVGLYACETLGGTGSFTPPFPSFRTTWSPAKKRPPQVMVGAGNMNCPREGIDGNACITASAGFSAFTYGARGCYNFGAKNWDIDTGLGIGTGTGVAGGGGITFTKCR